MRLRPITLSLSTRSLASQWGCRSGSWSCCIASTSAWTTTRTILYRACRDCIKSERSIRSKKRRTIMRSSTSPVKLISLLFRMWLLSSSGTVGSYPRIRLISLGASSWRPIELPWRCLIHVPPVPMDFRLAWRRGMCWLISSFARFFVTPLQGTLIPIWPSPTTRKKDSSTQEYVIRYLRPLKPSMWWLIVNKPPSTMMLIISRWPFSNLRGKSTKSTMSSLGSTRLWGRFLLFLSSLIDRSSRSSGVSWEISTTSVP